MLKANKNNNVVYDYVIGNDGFLKLSAKTEEMLLEAERNRREHQSKIGVVDAVWKIKENR